MRRARRRLRRDGRPVPAHAQGRRRARRQPRADPPPGRTPYQCAPRRGRGRKDHLRRRPDSGRHRAHAAPGRGRVHDRVRRSQLPHRHSRAQPEHSRGGGPASLRGAAARRRRGGARRAPGYRHRLTGRSRQAVLRTPPARDRAHPGGAAQASRDPDGDRGRRAGGPSGQRRAARRVRRRGTGRRGRGRALPDRVPVHEPKRSAGRAGAVRGIRGAGCGDEGGACHHSYPRSRRGQAGRRYPPRMRRSPPIPPSACGRCGCA